MKDKKYTKLHEWRQKAFKEDLPCAKCGRVGLMTIDHIVPHMFIDAFGLKLEAYDHDWNFQFLCRACNSLKRSQLDFANPKTFENLEKYIQLAKEFYG